MVELHAGHTKGECVVVEFESFHRNIRKVDVKSVGNVHGKFCYDKKLSYRRVTARCVLSVVMLSIATQHCRNYLYDKS